MPDKDPTSDIDEALETQYKHTGGIHKHTNRKLRCHAGGHGAAAFT